jgi:hypothetical protein
VYILVAILNIVAEVDGVDPPFMIAVVLVIAMLGTVKDALGMRNAGINDSLINERKVTYLMP